MQKLIEGLHRFRSEIFPARQGFFTSLAEGQSPETLFITCSDSRINPNLLTQTEPGELFILRNAGGIVPAYGPTSGGEAATIEFALQNLQVQHIVVCGHTKCGAMRALLDRKVLEANPAIARWLEHAESTRRLVLEHYEGLTGDALANVMVEENVLAQLENLRTHPAVKVRLARGDLSLHAWVYKIETGTVFQYDVESGQFTPIESSVRSVEGYVRRLSSAPGI